MIADALVVPQWHGPPEEDYDELSKQLNDNLLFLTPEKAHSFKNYYKNKEWAETEFEEGEFAIIQVDGIKVK